MKLKRLTRISRVQRSLVEIIAGSHSVEKGPEGQLRNELKGKVV